MKVLYGVQGTGNGHIARARVMAAALAGRNDIDVDFVFTGRAPEKYFDMEVFENYKTHCGLSFTYENGKVKKWETIRQANIRQFIYDVKQFDTSLYDLLINDFEPVTAWAAKRQGLPSISISHQAAFAYNIPKWGGSLFDNALMKIFAPTQQKIGVHWYHFNQPIIPPFVVDKPITHTNNSHILVYLPFENINDIRYMLEPLADQTFICFHPDVEHAETQGHIQLKPTSNAYFHKALQNCNGVVANGGFELSSEALQLGKKLLIKPLHGQFEQLSNVLMLDSLNLCHPLFQLDTDIVEEWLTSADIESITFPDNANLLIDWVVQGNYSDTKSLCETLWRNVHYGDKTRERLLSLAI